MLLLPLVLAASGGSDVYVSLPASAEVRRYDAASGTIVPHCSGIVTPFYGQVAADGTLYMQDATLSTIWKIKPDGTKSPVTSGGHIGIPLSVTIHPTTGDLYVSDALYGHVVKVDPATGTQTVFSDNSHGLYNIPGGLSFDSAGNLWMTDHGNFWIFKIDPAGVPTPILDGAGAGLVIPAGIEVDTAGNLFVAAYGSDVVVRVRMDTGEWEVFCDDPIIQWPNDVTLSPDGKGIIVACAGSSALVQIDPMGRSTILVQDASLGEFLGAAIPGNYPGSTGSMTAFGTGTPGSGGFVPRLSGIYSPTPGCHLAYDIDRLNGGATGLLVWSLGQGSLPIWGGTLYPDFTTLWGFFPFVANGAGAGTGEARLDFMHPNDPILIGIDFYLQVVAADKGAPFKKTLSNGLEVSFGSW